MEVFLVLQDCERESQCCPLYTHNMGKLVGKLTKKDLDKFRDRISGSEIPKNPHI